MPYFNQSLLRWLASNLPLPVITLLRYRREYLFTRNLLSVSDKQPSVYFFTTRKCASTMMRRLLADIARRHLEIVPINLVAYLWDVVGEGDAYGYLKRHSSSLFLEYGVLYAPLRSYIDVSRLGKARVVAMLRDPRDVIVSAYYSERFSHRPPASLTSRQRFTDRREHIKNVSMEDWLRNEANLTRAVYAEYRKNLNRSSVLTYEEMWTDFDSWMRRLGECLGISLDAPEIARYRRLAGADVHRPEDQHAHRRKGTPGDYLDKLSPALAEEFTAIFADELAWLYG